MLSENPVEISGYIFMVVPVYLAIYFLATVLAERDHG